MTTLQGQTKAELLKAKEDSASIAEAAESIAHEIAALRSKYATSSVAHVRGEKSKHASSLALSARAADNESTDRRAAVHAAAALAHEISALTQAYTDGPYASSFVTVVSEGNLSAERVATAGTGITLADGGAGGALTISTNDGEIDHGSLAGLSDDDHTQYLLADGTRTLTGNMSVDPGVTIDGVDISAHASDTANPHSTTIANIGSGTLAELNTAISDADVYSTTQVDSAIDADVATHAALTATHGVSGAIVGTTDIQTLTNKTIDTANNTITIVEADISDLGAYLENVSEDATPTLGGDLDGGTHNITNLGALTMTGTLDVTGSITVSGTVDGVDVAALSSAYTNHVIDTSDPHGATMSVSTKLQTPAVEATSGALALTSLANSDISITPHGTGEIAPGKDIHFPDGVYATFGDDTDGSIGAIGTGGDATVLDYDAVVHRFYCSGSQEAILYADHLTFEAGAQDVDLNWAVSTEFGITIGGTEKAVFGGGTYALELTETNSILRGGSFMADDASITGAASTVSLYGATLSAYTTKASIGNVPQFFSATMAGWIAFKVGTTTAAVPYWTI